ncbi:MAG: hypothetical protein KC656_31930, partial [Myxococcales bacterium]|nr:hypothetical protein [Myxococcales bacterium]
MALALAAYAAPVLVQVGFLCQTEAFVGALLVPTRLSPDNSDLGLWAILLLGPVLLLRAAQVLVDLPGEVPVTSELRLSWNLFQERSWELHSSVIVLLWLFLTFDEPVAQGLAPLFVLGAIPAMATLGALGRVLVVFPVFLVLALGGFYDTVDTARTPRHPAPVGVADLVDPSPPLATRLVSLVRIAWLPLLVALSVRAIQGW